MEKPLDLSQREEAEIRDDYLPNRDEPICQVTNCNCPLKHIMLLDSPKHQKDQAERNTYDTVSPPPQRGLSSKFNEKFAVGESGSSQGKRSSDFELNATKLHPKRRRMEMYNRSMTKSSSNGDLISLGGEDSGDRERFFIPSAMISNVGGPQDLEGKNENTTDMLAKNGELTRERSSSMTNIHVERLPKKRVQSRRNSPETVTKEKARSSPKESDTRSFLSPEISSLASVSPHDKFIGQTKVRPTCMTSLPTMTAQMTPASVAKPNNSNDSQSSKSSATSSDHRVDGGNSANKNAYDLKMLKAEMMKEIDLSNEKGDEEEIKPQRGNIFFSRNRARRIRRKSADDVTPAKPKDVPISTGEKGDSKKLQSLDYMILTTLMQSEDQPFKARNNHIHEIIRGEKNGRLCLMDLVELQVEMGLA